MTVRLLAFLAGALYSQEDSWYSLYHYAYDSSGL
jgi:hypothetical protein